MKELLQKHGSLFLRVGVVGAIGAAIQELFLFLLVTFLHWSPVVGNGIAFEVGITCNFLINNHFTFKHQSLHVLPKRFLLFNLSVLGSLVIQTAVVWAGDHIFGLEGYLFYAGFGIGIGWVLNYVLYTKFIWKYIPQQIQNFD